MKVSDLIKLLQEQNQNAEVNCISLAGEEWEWTSEPKVRSHKNAFGEVVWIS